MSGSFQFACFNFTLCFYVFVRALVSLIRTLYVYLILHCTNLASQLAVTRVEEHST